MYYADHKCTEYKGCESTVSFLVITIPCQMGRSEESFNDTVYFTPLGVAINPISHHHRSVVSGGVGCYLLHAMPALFTRDRYCE